MFYRLNTNQKKLNGIQIFIFEYCRLSLQQQPSIVLDKFPLPWPVVTGMSVFLPIHPAAGVVGPSAMTTVARKESIFIPGSLPTTIVLLIK